MNLKSLTLAALLASFASTGAFAQSAGTLNGFQLPNTGFQLPQLDTSVICRVRPSRACAQGPAASQRATAPDRRTGSTSRGGGPRPKRR